MAEWKPNDLITTVTSKKTGKTSQFISFRKATLWFHRDHPIPEGRIITEQISDNPIVFRASIYVGDWLVATAHANSEEREGFSKIESAAIRRALANAGYDADHAIHEFVKSQPPGEAQRKLGSGGQRRLGGNGQQAVPPPEPTASDAPPAHGEIRTFDIVGFQTRQTRFNKPYYVLDAGHGVQVFAFNRDVFRQWGYTDANMKNWDKAGYKTGFVNPLPVSAVWEADGNGGGNWKAWVEKAEEAPTPNGAQNLDDWFPERNGQ